MTVAAIESGGARAGSTRARQRRPTDAEMGRGGPQGPRGTAGPRGPSGQQGARGRQQRPARDRAGGKSRERRNPAYGRITGASTRPGSTLHNYQAIIAAEFVAASLLVAISPMATRQAQVSPTSGKLSPYEPVDLIKLWAIGMVYLILEGLAAGPRGLARFSAWFGFLIFIGIGLSQLSHLAKIFSTLAGNEINPVKLTGAQAPQTKGDVTIPPLGQGAASSNVPPPKTGG